MAQFGRMSSTLRTTLKTGEQDADGYAELAMLINACQAHPMQTVKQATTDIVN